MLSHVTFKMIHILTVHFNELLTLIIQKAISEIFTESKKKKAYGELISFLRIGFLKTSDSGKVELGIGSSFKGVEEASRRKRSKL